MSLVSIAQKAEWHRRLVLALPTEQAVLSGEGALLDHESSATQRRLPAMCDVDTVLRESKGDKVSVAEDSSRNLNWGWCEYWETRLGS